MRPRTFLFQSIFPTKIRKPRSFRLMILPMSQAHLDFFSHTENLAAVRAFVRRFLRGEGVPEPESEILVLGVDEACSNIIRHAYGHTPAQPISLVCERQGQTLWFRLRDFGSPADPAQFNREPREPGKPGGLGLQFIERIFEEVRYIPQTVGTELVLIKQLPCVP